MVQFNKMMVMLPIMFMARKLDSEDPKVVYWLRVAYACMQVICALVAVYTYVQASKVKADRVVYVPAAAMPFADPNAKKKYTETAYNAHVLSTARSLLGSTLFGIALTVGLHYYKGMVMGLAIQTVMAPLNLLENPLVKALFFSSSGTFRVQDRIFEEKVLSDLTADDEVVDEQGNPVVRRVAAGESKTADGEPEKSFEEIMLDTWDSGAKADVTPLMKAIDKKNCNHQTKEDSWTPLMILAGLNCPGTSVAIRTVIDDYGGNPAICDKEGWNALHWAAFHGSEEGAKELCQQTSLLQAKDKEGLTPLETARKEGNNTIADLLEEAMGESKKSK